MVRPQSTRKSNKDYCRKYREKNKEAFKEAEKQRKKFARDYEKHVDKEKYEARLKKDRLRSREYRKRKREESVQHNLLAPVSSSSSSSQQSTSSPKPTSAFSCKQALLFQPSDSILSEPSDIESAPVIPSTSTLKIHKLVRETNSKNGGSKINFFFLSNDDEPCHSKTYSKKIGCGHIDRDFDSLAEFRSTCAYCLERHMEDDETEDWLRCPMCMQWFHEGCFEQ